jgi:hypothetical protein
VRLGDVGLVAAPGRKLGMETRLSA